MKKTSLSTIIFLVLCAGIILYVAFRPAPVPKPMIETPVVAAPTPDKDLTLGQNGIGSIYFGEDYVTVVSELSKKLGAPTKDTGWISSFSVYGTCPGEKIRVVEWNNLHVLFGDTLQHGTQKFFTYEYVNRDTATTTPILATAQGVTLGTTKAELLAQHPKATISPWMDNLDTFTLARGESNKDGQYLGGTLENGKVFWIAGGVLCGE